MPPSPLCGQITVSGSAQRLSSPLGDVAAFIIKAPSTNSNSVYVGDANVTTSSGFILNPGDLLEYERIVQNGQPVYQLRPSDFYVVGTAPDKVSWVASP